ncbi:hypothetical protein BHE74_00010353 [Ensete ventricosum]|nr:hypothetical protein BHE74_00010353 [Ensete ventricosum]RZR90499.1 hypothetical protein BHM03_00018397 [Ensete ventricosum]
MTTGIVVPKSARVSRHPLVALRTGRRSFLPLSLPVLLLTLPTDPTSPALFRSLADRWESDGWFSFISSVECRALPLVLLHLFVLSNLLTLWSPLFGLILGDFCGRRCRCRCRSQSLRCVGLGNESSGSEGPMMTVVDGVRGGRAEVAGLRQGLNRGAIVVVVAAGY